MAQQKDMCSSSPVRAPKSHLAVEHPSTGGCWNLPKKQNKTKKTPCPKTKKTPQQDGRRGTITIKSNPIPTRWVTHKLESKVPKEFSHCCEGSEPHGRLHSLGQRDWEFPRNLTLKPSEIWLQNFHRTGGNRNSSLGGHNKTLHAPRLKGKEQWPHRRLNQNHLLVLEGLLWRRESAGAHYRDGGLDWEGPPWYTCSWCRVC